MKVLLGKIKQSKEMGSRGVDVPFQTGAWGGPTEKGTFECDLRKSRGSLVDIWEKGLQEEDTEQKALRWCIPDIWGTIIEDVPREPPSASTLQATMMTLAFILSKEKEKL